MFPDNAACWNSDHEGRIRELEEAAYHSSPLKGLLFLPAHAFASGLRQLLEQGGVCAAPTPPAWVDI